MKLMKSIMMTAALAMAAAVPIALPTTALAEPMPLVAGNYTSVSGIFVEDGANFTYAKYLADQWAKNQDFAKSKGWISDYKIYVNVDPRDGEPNIYLTQTFAEIPSGAESEKRAVEWATWRKKSEAEMDAESGDRAKFRTVKSSMLLQEYTVR